MPTPINRSSFLYNLFHSQSEDLSANERQRFKNIHIILGCTTLGLGHAICGIAYLIQRSCSKASKVQRVAQNQLNLPKNEEFSPLSKLIKDCVSRFEGECAIANLDRIEIMRTVENEQPQIQKYPILENLDKEALDKFLVKILSEAKTLIEPPSTGLSKIHFTMYSRVQDNGLQSTVNVTSLFENGKQYGVTGPGVRTENVVNPIHLDLPF